MWERSFSTDIKGTAEQVWDIWSDAFLPLAKAAGNVKGVPDDDESRP
jgi:hypothetical protein